MIHIFTPLKNGEAIMPEVMKGILNQSVECCLFPISNDNVVNGRWSEANRIENLIRAINLNVNDYFLIMDSDVVLGEPTIIEKMFEEKSDVVAVRTADYQTSCHSVLLVKGDKIQHLKNFLSTCAVVPERMCSMCVWVRSQGGNDFSKC